LKYRVEIVLKRYVVNAESEEEAIKQAKKKLNADLGFPWVDFPFEFNVKKLKL